MNVKFPAFVRLNPPPLIFDVHGVCDPPPPQPVHVPVMVKSPNVALGAVTEPFETIKPPLDTVKPSVIVRLCS